MNKQKILVLYTGGTIGMNHSKEGLRPDTTLINNALQPFVHQFEFDWHVCHPLIDSSAITLQNWLDWLTILADNISQYSGILILHGTDTMAYTANILSLALQGLNKPIILTGSQWPYDAPNSDAPLNLATAIAALKLNLPQVALAFHGQLFNAVGSTKISTETAAGFDNPHFGAIGTWCKQDGWHNINIKPSQMANEPFTILTLNPQVQVICHTLIPGASVSHLSETLKNTSAQAVILQSYGHGNAPSDAHFIDAISTFTQQGRLVLNISQVQQGCAAAVYAQGDALRQAGVINGGKCNLETATALLTLALSNHWQINEIQQQLKKLNLL